MMMMIINEYCDNIENDYIGSKRAARYLVTSRIVLNHSVNNISVLDLEVSSLLRERLRSNVVIHHVRDRRCFPLVGRTVLCPEKLAPGGIAVVLWAAYGRVVIALSIRKPLLHSNQNDTTGNLKE